MATASDHGFGGPAARRAEQRYTAASLVAGGVLVAAAAFWVMLGRDAVPGVIAAAGTGVLAVGLAGPVPSREGHR